MLWGVRGEHYIHNGDVATSIHWVFWCVPAPVQRVLVNVHPIASVADSSQSDALSVVMPLTRLLRALLAIAKVSRRRPARIGGSHPHSSRNTSRCLKMKRNEEGGDGLQIFHWWINRLGRSVTRFLSVGSSTTLKQKG